MRTFSSAATLARSKSVATRHFSSVSGYSRTAAPRRVGTSSTSGILARIPGVSRSTLSSSSPFSALNNGSYPPHQILLRQSSSALVRQLHTSSSLFQQTQPQKKPEESIDPQAKTENTSASPDPKQTKSQAQDSQSSESASKGEGEQQGEEPNSEKKKDDADATPPPPHGDKTPWQVFTETLSSEFKKSKEWNDSTKQLAAGYQEFTQNPNLQRAKSAYTSATGAASSTAGAAIKKTGKVVGSSAAWAWDTTLVKGVRAGANATGRGLEKVTRPVRETEAYKNVKEVIDDGSSARYGGWVEKEERRKRREAREAREMGAGGRRSNEPAVEDPEAGTNVTLHKDSAWQEKWRDFKDNSRVMQSLFSMRSAYHESENPLISTARAVSDRVAGFFAENETAMVIKKFREMDPSFQLEPFLQEMREYILPEVLDAYVKGDVETLKLWLSAAQYQVYAALMQQYTTAGLKSDGRVLDIRHVDIVSAKILDPGDIPIFLITCRTQEVHVYRNAKSGELAAGMDDKVQQVTYVIGMTRIPEDVANPETRGWRLIELQKSARDYI